MNEIPPAEAALRARAIDLFSYLKRFVELRAPSTRSLDDYEETIWLADVPRERECRCALWTWGTTSEEPESWLEVQRPKLTPAPVPPNLIGRWMVPSEWTDPDVDVPGLSDSISEFSEASEVAQNLISLSDHPEVKAAWEAYIEDEWWPWQEEARRQNKVLSLYTRLFSIRQQLEREGEQFEFMLGFGVLSGRGPTAYKTRRHLLTARAVIQFDAQRGLLTVGPSGEGSTLQLEQDMLELEDRPSESDTQPIESQLESLGEVVWDRESICALLNAWAHSYAGSCAYSESTTAPPLHQEPASVVLAPALFLRRRGATSWISAFAQVVAQLEGGVGLPSGVQRFVGDATKEAPRRGEVATAPPSVHEVYFPLPANIEQAKILSRLEAHDGVVVQGPPGTGKSHTIVNLLCHLLATGKRVLVTSHAARALGVLKRYISERAPEISPLAVLQLGEGTDAMQEMERSVQGITSKQSYWDPERAASEVQSIEHRLERAREENASALRLLREAREKETLRWERVAGRYSGSMAEIARRLQSEEVKLSWLPDRVASDSQSPISDDDFQDFCHLMYREDVLSFVASGATVPDVDLLPSAERFRDAVSRSLDAASLVAESLRGLESPLLGLVSQLAPDARSRLDAEVTSARALVERYLATQNWESKAFLDAAKDASSTWRELERLSASEVELLQARAKWFDRTPVRWPSGLDLASLKAGAQELRAHFESGKGTGLFGPLRPEVVRRNDHFKDQVTVSGRRCWDAGALASLLQWIETRESLDLLKRSWRPYIELPESTAAALNAAISDALVALQGALASGVRLATLRRDLETLLPGKHVDLTQKVDIESLLAAIRASNAEDARSAAELEAMQLAKVVAPPDEVANASPGWLALQVAVRERDCREYLAALKAVERERELKRLGARYVDLLSRLQASAPELVAALEDGKPSALAAAHPDGLSAAWAWRAASQWLVEQLDPEQEGRSRANLSSSRTRIQVALSELAASKAWEWCFQRMSDHETQHLISWSKSVKAIGKGKGKYASKHRDDARRHMAECRSAIPAWIMPLYRVAETIPPTAEAFDVAIIDEASQSGPEALLVAYLSKKVVVVGDDQQIAPSYVGLNRTAVHRLQDEFLKQIPHADRVGTDSSFFDLADIRYPGRVRLREHFRCMPEIIEFSNQLSYQDRPLVPLRQFGNERLIPVQAHFVPGGNIRTSGSKVVNAPEARAVIEWLCAAIKDPRYKGKTFGVISLQGDSQAREIEQGLVKALGPAQFRDSQIVCGDAYAFQGDERDVIALSLVAAVSEDRRIGSLTKEDDRRRFNVAASRARDQMVLFHSVWPSDLSPGCFRWRLLSYCLSPGIRSAEWAGASVSEYQMLAVLGDRQRDTPPEPFESWFELDVFLRIAARGYKVLPQYEVNGFRIDLVVETARDRIAVECDGDHWHGAERYESDASRQRDLERCGWVFFRLRESTFRFDEEASLKGLWALLESRAQAQPRLVPEMVESLSVSAPESDLRLGDGESVEEASAPLGIDESEAMGRETAPEEVEGSTLGEGTLLLWRGGKGHPPEPERPSDLLLPPYREWTGSGLADPLTSSLDRIITGLLSILQVEGPVRMDRLCRVYVVGAGGQRAGKSVRHQVHAAVALAARSGRMIQQLEPDSSDIDGAVVYLPGRSRVEIRGRGPRSFEEIPSSEVAQLMLRVQQRGYGAHGIDLFRATIAAFGFGRMTVNMNRRLQEISRLLSSFEVEA